jgi:hypothetical protein
MGMDTSYSPLQVWNGSDFNLTLTYKGTPLVFDPSVPTVFRADDGLRYTIIPKWWGAAIVDEALAVAEGL